MSVTRSTIGASAVYEYDDSEYRPDALFPSPACTASATCAAFYEYASCITGTPAKLNEPAESTRLQAPAAVAWRYYYGLRLYSPAIGRWISRDPAGEAAAANLVNMCENDTVEQIDALGLWSDPMRSSDVEYGTTCADTGDSVDTLLRRLAVIQVGAEQTGIFLDRGEAFGERGWLRDEIGNAVSSIAPGRTYRFPNKAIITYGMMGTHMIGFDARMGEFTRRLKQLGYYVDDHWPPKDNKGQTSEEINAWLSKDKYVAIWGHAGHGPDLSGYLPRGSATLRLRRVGWGRGGLLLKDPGNRLTADDPVLRNSAYGRNLVGVDAGHFHWEFTPHHKLSYVLLYSCFAGNNAQGWLTLVAPGGVLAASRSAIVIDNGVFTDWGVDNWDELERWTH